jgi:hypothetical protein
MSDEVSFFYAGPKFGGLRNVVYRGGMPAHAAPFIEKIPALAELFIPVNPDQPPRIEKARLDVKTKGTKLHAFAEVVRAWIREDQKRRHAAPAALETGTT